MQSLAKVLGLVAAVVVLAPSAAPAQEWARKMFGETVHSFGTVARGSKAEHRFSFRNPYNETIHITGVRTSCGCTSPVVTKESLKTYETAEVIAKFNTRSFLGQHGATLTVTIDKPFPAEVQLRVSGNIRSDVSFDPPLADLGNVELGSGSERTVRVSHAGSTPWEISDVRSANEHFEVMLSKPTRTAAETIYDLTVRLKPEAPAGYVNGQLILVTNDPRASEIPMDVEGRVVAAVTVSPQLLALGVLKQGEMVTKNLVVRANRPFRVTGVECSDDGVDCRYGSRTAAVQILPVTFRAGTQTGRIERLLRIATDLGENSVPGVTLQVTVEPPVEQASAESAVEPGKSGPAVDAGGQSVRPPADGRSERG